MSFDKIHTEMDHGDRISERAEMIWGWGSPAGQARVKRRISSFLEFVGSEKRSSVLEIGCGIGIFSRHLVNDHLDVATLDISMALIKKSREATGVKVSYVQGDAQVLPFGDGTIDCVFGISVLHHLDLPKTLQELARVLRKGGKLFFTEPNMLNPQVFLIKNVGFIKRYYHEVPHETAFIRWNLKKALAQAGFTNISISNFDFVHPGIPGPFVSAAEKFSGYLERIPVIKEISGSLLIKAEKNS